jgi:hypothetical protein
MNAAAFLLAARRRTHATEAASMPNISERFVLDTKAVAPR